MANTVRNVAPFIDDVFSISSEWWKVREDPITHEITIHRGLDITTGTSKLVYSMLTGIVHSKGTDDSQGNWIVIKDNNPLSQFYGYATLYMHLAQPSDLNVGDSVIQGQYVAMEGTTGHSTGIHLHVEMQDLNRFNNRWHWSYTKSDYIDPTEFMGIDNVAGTSWLYDGSPYVPTKRKKVKFPWVLYARKIREKSHIR